MQQIIKNATHALDSGEVIGIPTETVYGLAVDALNESAIQQLYALKKRDAKKPSQLLLPSADHAMDYALFPKAGIILAECFWPGPLTLVLPRKKGCTLPLSISAGKPTLGIRVPDHDLLRTLLDAYRNPLLASSANEAGEPPAVTSEELKAIFPTQLGYIIEAEPSEHRVASTVIDMTGNHMRFLREGAISKEEITQALS